MIVRIGGADECSDFVVRENDIARFLRVRQSGEANFPRVAVSDAIIVLRGQRQGGAYATAESG